PSLLNNYVQIIKTGIGLSVFRRFILKRTLVKNKPLEQLQRFVLGLYYCRCLLFYNTFVFLFKETAILAVYNLAFNFQGNRWGIGIRNNGNCFSNRHYTIGVVLHFNFSYFTGHNGTFWFFRDCTTAGR